MLAMHNSRNFPIMEDMLADIEANARSAASYTGRSIISKQVMQALASVPREKFVPDILKHQAYINSPLPIGHGQTISQPLIVAIMTDLLNIKSKEAVILEIGTGCGYQSAILAELADQVYSIEIVDKLAQESKKRLARLGYTNVHIKSGDGYYGWLEHAPYDGILVTAAIDDIPSALIDQLKPGGRLVIPIGTQSTTQNLFLIKKNEDGSIKQRIILPVAFVAFKHN